VFTILLFARSTRWEINDVTFVLILLMTVSPHVWPREKPAQLLKRIAVMLPHIIRPICLLLIGIVGGPGAL
jgi:hypothetical protein